MRPHARRKPRGTGLTVWVLAQAARLSPVARLDLIDGARAVGFIDRSPIGLTTFKNCLKRLRAKGCIDFDQTTVTWTGHSLPVGGMSGTVRARIHRAAAGDMVALGRLRQEEIDRLQQSRDAALAATRPADAPPFVPAAPQVQKPRRPIAATPSMRETLKGYLTSPAARAIAAQYREPASHSHSSNFPTADRG